MSEHSAKVRASVKKWLESGDDSFFNEFKNALQQRADAKGLQVLSRRIVERYEDGRLSLHFHFPEPGGNGGHIHPNKADASKYCAIAQFLAAEKGLQERAVGVTPLDARIAGDSGDQIKLLVLVDVMKMSKAHERLIPTVVRLQTLDECLSLFGHAIQVPASNCVLEELRRPADRELIASTGLASTAQHKLPHNVIEGAPDVEQEIADYNREPVMRLGQMHSQHAELRIGVLLGNDLALAVLRTPEHLHDGLEMFLCPDQFEVRSR